MSTNPLFPSEDTADDKPGDAPLPARSQKKIEPAANPAADLIRQKLATLYTEEPNAKKELAEMQEIGPTRSKHQQYMYDLSTSGKSLAEIQTEWHSYYVGLSDHEKHEVWQEFYDSSAQAAHTNQHQPTHHPTAASATMPHSVLGTTPTHSDVAEPGEPVSKAIVSEHEAPAKSAKSPRRDPAAVKQQLLNKINTASGPKLQVKHHVQSLLFGLGFGALVVVLVLFSFFNEVVIAPFIQPSRKVSATPIIVGIDGVAPTKNPEIIIPKINVEIPLDFSVKTTDESQIEGALEHGVVHYPTTVLPGQKGNTAFFGHSSNNIFNPGKYKFAFVLLHELVPGDTFYLTYNGKVYAYQVYAKRVVDPSEVSVLNSAPGKTATATLITCDPPGTSLHRLVVWGEQVSPSPIRNTAAAPTETISGQQQELPGNGPTLWGRMVRSIKSWF